MPSVEFDARGLLDALDGGGVRYVVIGGVAGAMLGSPLVTEDLDVCHARDRPNLEALAGVLRTVNARLRGVDIAVPFRLDAKALAAGDSFTFVTDLGDFDILGTPWGTAGYDDLIRSAEKMEIGGRLVMVASVDDLIRMKQAAGRPKDLFAVELLGALREEAASYG